ncbi:(2Fe-2S)-binding protein [Agrobacterium sp. rho-13.3]|uniref:(2Fe-2S)-binding protein n=1 Tax=Agrobacterium sp. rho-13.3 TaxID=3072980 RepID=UPI002A0BFDE5|nr:(2Fe-2S)-binding protein [Agrobacterium sp. rho-13.3]MDX8309192.1 (2Fe-2S)-binding protein [Agrobacterium sp. rho-13.3]
MTLPVCLNLNVNGSVHRVEASLETPLLYILRNDLSLNGPKYGCGIGECGACAVLVDGRAVRSCTVPLGAIGTRQVTTLEGLGTPEHLHPTQAAFIDEAAAQCGYCLNGMIIATASLLNRNSDPDENDIREALRHHLCRCGTHMEILAAVRRAVGYMKIERTRQTPSNTETPDVIEEASP